VNQDRVSAVDSDVDLHIPAQRRELAGTPWPVLVAIAVGGALGALARYGLTVLWPHASGAFPWATFVINVSGCLLIGCLMVLVDEAGVRHRLLRPFFGVGVLGGFTTFSSYVLDVQQLLSAGAAARALLYLAGTVLAALLAVWVGRSATGIALSGLRRRIRARRQL